MSLSAATVQEIFQDLGLFVRTWNIYGSEIPDLIEAETVSQRAQLGSGDDRLETLGDALSRNNQNIESIVAMKDAEVQTAENYILDHLKTTIQAAGDSATEVLEDLTEQMIEEVTPAQYVVRNEVAAGAAAADSNNAGDGTLGSVGVGQYLAAQRVTVECTDATTTGAETWSVTGSVDGVMDSATTGVAYEDTDTELGFTITAGATAFEVGDKFYFYITCTERRYQTFFRDNWGVVMPSVASGSETILESWTR
ncbi:MAG: hypothetical protein ACOC8E_09070 [Planctomycetota bacterium]